MRGFARFAMQSHIPHTKSDHHTPLVRREMVQAIAGSKMVPRYFMGKAKATETALPNGIARTGVPQGRR